MKDRISRYLKILFIRRYIFLYVLLFLAEFFSYSYIIHCIDGIIIILVTVIYAIPWIVSLVIIFKEDCNKYHLCWFNKPAVEIIIDVLNLKTFNFNELRDEYEYFVYSDKEITTHNMCYFLVDKQYWDNPSERSHYATSTSLTRFCVALELRNLLSKPHESNNYRIYLLAEEFFSCSFETTKLLCNEATTNFETFFYYLKKCFYQQTNPSTEDYAIFSSVPMSDDEKDRYNFYSETI